MVSALLLRSHSMQESPVNISMIALPPKTRILSRHVLALSIIKSHDIARSSKATIFGRRNSQHSKSIGMPLSTCAIQLLDGMSVVENPWSTTNGNVLTIRHSNMLTIYIDKMGISRRCLWNLALRST